MNSRYASAGRAGRGGLTSSSTTASTGMGMGTGTATSSTATGVDETTFLRAFDDTPTLDLPPKELKNELARVVADISNANADWEGRVQAIKDFRVLVKSGAADLEDFHTTTLKQLEIPLQNNICDLRSQVVKETCITIAFVSRKLKQKFSRMAEMLLPSLVKLIPNSAKIMSTSALEALRFIIKSTHNSKLILVIKYQLSNSKSKDIHRALCEITEKIVNNWPPNIIELRLQDMSDVIKLGICDSDELARHYARRAFNVFAEHFREPADKLFNSLDQQRQRMLNNLNHGGGSTPSLNGFGSTSHLPTLAKSSGPSSIATSTNLMSRLKNSVVTTNGNAIASPSRIRAPTARSTSAIDVAAQKRAKSRAVYLSSMYTRPRQLGTIHSPSANHHHHQQHLHSSPYQHQQQQIQQQYSQLPTSQTSNSSPAPAKIDTTTTTSSFSLTPNIAQQQQKFHQLQQQQAASADKRDGVALSKAASYLLSVIKDNSIAESQIVVTIKYFTSLIEKHPTEVVSKLLPEIMPPLVIGIDNTAICVRKASVFSMVAIHSKVGLKEMESYLTTLTMTQRKLLEVYIKKFKEDNRSSIGSNNSSGFM